MTSTKKDSFSILGLGAAACLACCAGPILAVLGGVSIAGLASTWLIGASGLVIAAAAAIGFVVVRRRQAASSCATDPAEPTPDRADHAASVEMTPIDPPRSPGEPNQPVGAPMRPIPIYDATAPIACAIDPTNIPERIALVECMRTRLAHLERTDHGLLLHFAADADTEADVRRFAVDEKRCCQFWGFAVATTSDDLTLRWDGPPNAAEILDHLEAFFNGDEPASGLAALL